MSEEKKNPTRAQIFQYFRIESRNNKTMLVSGQIAECSDCLLGLWSSNRLKQIKNVIKFNEGNFFNLRFLQKSSHHQIYHHIKYKVIVTNQLWQISFFQPIWNDFYDRLNLR